MRQSLNECQCTIPDGGFCERHKMQKSAHWVQLCQTRENYFLAWETGTNGPGQQRLGSGGAAKVRSGLGDNVERMLKTLGITAERYIEVKKRFGLPPTCNCAGRREWLNKVGRWLAGE
jgi:hypothetical protein